MIIEAYVFNTEPEVLAKISEINEAEGFPSEAAETYCNHELNNTKWIVKYSSSKSPTMASVFGYEPSDFDYIEPIPGM